MYRGDPDPNEPVQAPDHAAGSAAAALATIPVKGRAPKTGYDRDQYGTSWTDDNNVSFGHNGCDTRNDILRRDLYNPVIKANTNGCVALSGELRDLCEMSLGDELRHVGDVTAKNRCRLSVCDPTGHTAIFPARPCPETGSSSRAVLQGKSPALGELEAGLLGDEHHRRGAWSVIGMVIA